MSLGSALKALREVVKCCDRCTIKIRLRRWDRLAR
jgi:hypothetical protein